MKRRTSATRSVSAECVAVVEVAAIRVVVIEAVAIDDCSAVRDVGVVVINQDRKSVV